MQSGSEDDKARPLPDPSYKTMHRERIHDA